MHFPLMMFLISLQRPRFENITTFRKKTQTDEKMRILLFGTEVLGSPMELNADLMDALRLMHW